MAKISVVIPVYNAEKTIARCLDSILSQSFSDNEVIAVSDGSTDGSLSILRDYERKEPRVRVLKKENGGASSARNAGMREAGGEYLFFVDADDFLFDGALEALYACLHEYGADCVRSGFVYYREGDPVPPALEESAEVTCLEGEEIRKVYVNNTLGIPYRELAEQLSHGEPGNSSGIFGVSSCHVLYRAGVIRENGLQFREDVSSMAEDSLFNLEFTLHAQKIAYLSRPLYAYAVFEDSTWHTTARRGDKYLKAKLAYWYAKKDYCEKYGLSGEETERYLCNITLGVVQTGIVLFNRHTDMGFFRRCGMMRRLLRDPLVRTAMERLPLGGIPFQYRLPLFCAKHRLAFLLSAMCWGLNALGKSPYQ